jgi:hypothetical protein
MLHVIVSSCIEWKFGCGGGNITWKAHVIRRTDKVREAACPLTRRGAFHCHPRPEAAPSRPGEAVRSASRGARGLAQPSLAVLARVAVAAKAEQGDQRLGLRVEMERGGGTVAVEGVTEGRKNVVFFGASDPTQPASVSPKLPHFNMLPIAGRL